TSLITGVAGLGQADRLGKMFGRTMTYYVTTSMLAILTGLVLVNLIQPGQHEQAAAEAVAASGPREVKSLGAVMFEQVENLIPPTPIEAAATGNFLSIIAFSILIGVCTIVVGGRPALVITELADAAFQVLMRMPMAIIRLAPFGVLFL